MLLQYIKVVIRHAVNFFSLASLILGLIAVIFFRFGDVANAIIVSGVALLSILVASYSAWKEAVEALPMKVAFSIELDSINVTSTTITDAGLWSDTTSDALLNTSLAFFITLDVINRGDEPVMLRALNVTKFETGTEFLDIIPDVVGISLREGENSRRFTLPFTVDSGSRLQLVCSVPSKFSVLERLEFSRRLVELKDVEIEISYTFDDMERLSHTRTITIHRSLISYVEEKIQGWADDDENRDLAIAALKARGTIKSS